MAVFVVGLVFILALAGYSDASYCVCSSGFSDSVLQKNIDYACGNGADCSAILPSGPCFNPNTVKDHCSYAVNSYYQKKVNAPMSCNFQGTANVTNTPPSVSPGCVYPSNAGGATPSTTPPTGGTPTTLTPPASPTTPTPPGDFPGSSTTPPGVPGSPVIPGFSPGPTVFGGVGTNSASVKLLASQSSIFMLVATILVYSLFFPTI